MKISGKLKAGLRGGIMGAIIVLVVELLAVVINGDSFFGSERSWLILGLGVVVFGWGQMRAYDRNAQEAEDRTSQPGD